MVSTKRPLFNRKYLLALVWLLPIVVLFLNSDYLNSGPYDKLQRLSDRIGWLPTQKSEPEMATLFLKIGSGLENLTRAHQQYFVQALSARLRQPDLRELAEQQAVKSRISSNQSYIKIDLESTEPFANWLPILLTALKEPPSIDWDALERELSAEQHVQAAEARTQLYRAGTFISDLHLTPDLYLEQLEPNLSLVIRADKKPIFESPLNLGPRTKEVARELLPRHEKLNTRTGAGADLYAWLLPGAVDIDNYLAQQLIGQVVSARLSAIPNARWVQQLSRDGGIAILETSKETAAALHNRIFAEALFDVEISTASDAFIARWTQFIERSPLDWPGILMMNGYALEDPKDVLARLNDEKRDILLNLWRELGKPATRTVHQSPL